MFARQLIYKIALLKTLVNRQQADSGLSNLSLSLPEPVSPSAMLGPPKAMDRSVKEFPVHRLRTVRR